jgi:hypothetical protein
MVLVAQHIISATLTYEKHSGFCVLPAVRFQTLPCAHVAYYLGRNVVEEDNKVKYKS